MANKAGLAFLLRKHNVEGLTTTATLTNGELQKKAKAASCEVILLCNEETLANHVPGKLPTADKWRGSRLTYDVPIICINKLSHIYSIPHGQWLLEKDIEKIKHVKRKAQPFSYEKLVHPKFFEEALNDLSKAIFVAHDIETRGFGGDTELRIAEETVITCAAWTGYYGRSPYGEDIYRTYMLPLVCFERDFWEKDEEYALALQFLRRANGLSVPKSMHNGMYDSTHCLVYGAPPINWTYDTMAMSHAEFSELPKTLDFTASTHLYDYLFWKDAASEASKNKDNEHYWTYNAKDTWNTARITVSQLRSVPQYARRNFAKKFHLVYPALYGSFEGLLVDAEERGELRGASAIQYDKAKDSLRIKFADPGFNPGSWRQVETYIYHVFGAKKPGIGKGGKPRLVTDKKTGLSERKLGACTDDKNLKAVAEQHPLLAQLTEDILDYREASKAIGTYYDFMQKNGRLLWALNPFGTETERMSSNSSSFWCGTQIQNIPGYAKGMLVADPGFELFEADNKQSEGRTTAYLAQDLALIAALEDAEHDFYKTLGTLFFNIPYAEVSDFFRNKVLKRIVHGTNYMMGGGTFIENVGAKILFETAQKLGFKILESEKRPKEEKGEYTLRGFAKMLLDLYHKPFPRVRAWYKEIFSEVAETGFLRSPTGHMRKFFGDIKKDHNMLRSAVAHAPQNLSVEILNKGFRRVYTELVLSGGGDIRLKTQIHDSIFGQWRIGMANHYAPRVLACMDNPIIVHGRELRIPVDIKYGHRWKEYEVDKKTGLLAKGSYEDGTRKWKGPAA